jgi:energy-coupling factor transporter transmembrane protein EcfT
MKTSFTQKEHAESGLALIVILLAASLFVHATFLVQIAIGLLILDMAVPVVFYPFTLIWLNLSHALGRIISFIILTLIFLLVVTPTALVRRLIGKDRLFLSEFKKSSASVFHERNHRFVKEDSLHPF